MQTTYEARTVAQLAPVLSDIPVSVAAGTPTLASWPLRTAALLVDGCVVGGASLVLGAPGALSTWAAWPLASACLSVPLGLAYLTVAHGSHGGQTIGDHVNGIAVRSDALGTGSGGRCSYGQAFGRSLMLGVFLALFLFGGFLDFMWPLWDRRRQAWHDKVAGTIVVRASARG